MTSNISIKQQTSTSSDKQTALRLLIARYHRQLTVGCGKDDCDNEFCVSSKHFCLGHLDHNKAAAKALELAKNKSNLCEERAVRERSSDGEKANEHDLTVTAAIGGASSSSSCLREAWVEDSSKGQESADKSDTKSVMDKVGCLSSSSSGCISTTKKPEKITGVTEEEIMRIIDSCEKAVLEGAPYPWSPLIRIIGKVFNEPEAVMNSFLICTKPRESASLGCDVGEASSTVKSTGNLLGLADSIQSKEDIRSMEVDQDKDHDSEDDDTDVSNMDATSASDVETGEQIAVAGRSGVGELNELTTGRAEADELATRRSARKRSSSRSGVLSREDSPAVTSKSIVSSPDTDKHVALSLDLDAVKRVYARLFAIPDLPFQASLINAIYSLSRTIELDRRMHNVLSRCDNYINVFLIVMEIPHLDSLEFLESATPAFCKALGLVSVEVQAKLVRVWAGFEADQLRAMVQRLQQLITVRVVTNQWTRSYLVNDDDSLTSAAKVLKMFYYASLLGGRMDPPDVLERERQMKEEASGNLTRLLQGAIGYDHKERQAEYKDPLAVALGNIRVSECQQPLIPASEFVNESLSDTLEMDKDYTNYRAVLATSSAGLSSDSLSNTSSHFSFMLHPFMLSTAVKNTGMFYDNRIRMMSERRESMFQSMMHGNITMPYLRLHIRRDHIISDSLVKLEVIAMDNPQDLKKQLYVEFDGEQGIDEGGVSKEFFQMIVEEIFNPDIGMFTFMKETGTFWFNSTSFENDGQFMLIGIVLGLAIYNNVILDIHFPMVVYRKLMGKLGTYSDLVTSHPIIAQSLKELLEYEGDVAETFMQPFGVGTSDCFGNSHVHLLKENGDQIIVTNETRQEFVDLYADFLLNKSVDKQFRAFQRGFQMVTDESPLSMLFYPEEIELLVCGSQVFDFHALEKATEYDGGYTSETPVIRYFWDVVVNELTDDQKRQFLQFTTGSDRAPIGGLSKLKLVIARNGPDSDRLPTSHTCFNVLLLPEYATKEKLTERLLKAIMYSKGFGML